MRLVTDGMWVQVSGIKLTLDMSSSGQCMCNVCQEHVLAAGLAEASSCISAAGILSASQWSVMRRWQHFAQTFVGVI